ncbi:MAG: hypothetical protein D6830_02380 [Ignavibacteria bacterium]|nr:MAG: hypothetical protein D6830_02380 [Ignavibacteria bacterium]
MLNDKIKNIMKNYIEALRENVCAVCVDSQDGDCTLLNDEICALEFHYKKIVELVHNLESDNIWEQYDELKNTICSECRDKSDEGGCSVRKDANCSLDRYFPLIVDTIRKVDLGVY